LIALYERVVGFYASKIGVNAYDQPGVEAGKKAAQEILVLQQQIMAGEEVPETDDTWLLKEYLALR
jgi:glucose-6-phosphate isomerase